MSNLKVSDVVKEGKTGQRKLNFKFAGKGLDVDMEVRYERLDAKKHLNQIYKKVLTDKEDRVVVRKLAEKGTGKITEKGKNTYAYFYQNQDGTIGQQMLNEKPVEKIINVLTSKTITPSKERFFIFERLVKPSILNEFYVEDVYKITADNFVKLREVAMILEKEEKHALYRFSPNGTSFYAFLYPVIDTKSKQFHLVAAITRLKMTTMLGVGMPLNGTDLEKKLEEFREMEAI